MTIWSSIMTRHQLGLSYLIVNAVWFFLSSFLIWKTSVFDSQFGFEEDHCLLLWAFSIHVKLWWDISSVLEQEKMCLMASKPCFIITSTYNTTIVVFIVIRLTLPMSCIKNHHDSRHHQRRALKAGVVRDGYWCTTTTPEFQNDKMRFAQFADSGQ